MVTIPSYPAKSFPSSHWLDITGDSTENKTSGLPTSEDNLNMQLSAARQFLLGSDNPVSPTTVSLVQDSGNSEVSIDSSGLSTYKTNPDSYSMWCNQDSQSGVLFNAVSSSFLAQKQMFRIQEISPGWGYVNEDTKVYLENIHKSSIFTTDIMCYS